MRRPVRGPLIRLLGSTLAAAATAVLLGGCVTFRRVGSQPPSLAISDPGDTRLGRALEPGERAHPGETGFGVLAYGQESLVARMTLADSAQRTIDAQYYIYTSDAAGSVLLQHLLKAADRGVRVRLLLDDYNIGNDHELAALCTRPNFEIRIFNPVSFRARWARLAEYALSFGHADHRMHNKLFIADNAFAILGGRNIGDDYFNIDSDSTFRDFDLIAGGPATHAASAAFDEYWNSPWAVSADRLIAGKPSRAAVAAVLRRIAARADKAAAFEERYDALRGRYLSDLLRDPAALVWAPGEIVSDPPPPVDGDDGGESPLAKRLDEQWRAARHEVLIESAYFVPSKQGIRTFRGLTRRGVSVKLLTCGLATTDVPIVYCAYARYRRQLLRAGVELHEYRPESPAAPAKKPPWYRAGRSYAVLHSKALVFDRRRIWIGSLNLDPRSIHINTEIAAIIDSKVLAERLAADFNADMAPDRSWKLSLAPDGRISWTGTVKGKLVTRFHQPASWPRRFDSLILSLFPGLENQL
ncbi:MAG: phospholipase D-like domain-containing protein [Opitutaceae bacterium]